MNIALSLGANIKLVIWMAMNWKKDYDFIMLAIDKTCMYSTSITLWDSNETRGIFSYCQCVRGQNWYDLACQKWTAYDNFFVPNDSLVSKMDRRWMYGILMTMID